MSWCRTRPSTSPMETCPSTSEPRSSPATTSRPRSPLPSVAMSTSRRAGARASTRSSSASASARAARSVSSASSSAEWINTVAQPRRDIPRLPRPHREVRPPHRAQRRLHDGQRRGQAGRLARLPRDRQHQLRRDPGESTLEVIETLEELREQIPPQLYDMVAGSRPAARRRRPRHLTLAVAAGGAGRCGMTTIESRAAIRVTRPAQVVRQAGRPRRHRPRGRRRHGLRAPRAERRRQDDDGPHPLDPHRRRRRRGRRSAATTSPASPMRSAP